MPARFCLRWPCLVLASACLPLTAWPAFAQALTGSETRERIKPLLELVSTSIEVSGVGMIVLAALGSTLYFVYSGFFGAGWPDAFHLYRAYLGRGILLGLELLVAADIIGTVAVTPSIDNLIILGFIILIRTFLSFSLEIEIEGHLPWERHPDEKPRAVQARQSEA